MTSRASVYISSFEFTLPTMSQPQEPDPAQWPPGQRHRAAENRDRLSAQRLACRVRRAPTRRVVLRRTDRGRRREKCPHIGRARKKGVVSVFPFAACTAQLCTAVLLSCYSCKIVVSALSAAEAMLLVAISSRTATLHVAE